MPARPGIGGSDGRYPPAGGNLWCPHEYMPNENIYDPSGANPLGRWDYGPWLNPATIPINPNLPSPTITPEFFADTMVVNGTAFPYLNVPPTAVRFRILNACNDRSSTSHCLWPTRPTRTEVKMVPAAPNRGLSDLADRRPYRRGARPDHPGPFLDQIGNEGGLLPQVAVIPPQPVDIRVQPAGPDRLRRHQPVSASNAGHAGRRDRGLLRLTPGRPSFFTTTGRRPCRSSTSATTSIRTIRI